MQYPDLAAKDLDDAIFASRAGVGALIWEGQFE